MWNNQKLICTLLKKSSIKIDKYRNLCLKHSKLYTQEKHMLRYTVGYVHKCSLWTTQRSINSRMDEYIGTLLENGWIKTTPSNVHTSANTDRKKSDLRYKVPLGCRGILFCVLASGYIGIHYVTVHWDVPVSGVQFYTCMLCTFNFTHTKNESWR